LKIGLGQENKPFGYRQRAFIISIATIIPRAFASRSKTISVLPARASRISLIMPKKSMANIAARKDILKLSPKLVPGNFNIRKRATTPAKLTVKCAM
jgi:hypothetical protein